MSESVRHGGSRGQILVIAVLAMVALIAMVGLVVDGGAAFAQQRVAQNGADATSTAGTVVIAEHLGGTPRTGQQVRDAIDAVAAANGLGNVFAEYTDDFGQPIGQVVDPALAIPSNARGVRAAGSRPVGTTFANVIGINNLTASAEATVVAGALSGECVPDEDGCTLLPVTFPISPAICDDQGVADNGNLWGIGAPPPGNPGGPYWPLVSASDLPSGSYPGNFSTMAILPLCRSASGGSGAFGWLDVDPTIPNLSGEITGPINATVNIPGWFQTQSGTPNSVEGELLTHRHKPVLLPLNRGACRTNPGPTVDTCPAGQGGVDPVGNNTWYYVHTLAVFYIDRVHVQGSDRDACTTAPGQPLVPVQQGAGFLGCLKGWFVSYVTSGPIVPGGQIIPGQTAIGIQLIR